MNGLMTKLLGSSWRTTIGGAMVGVPPLVFAAAQAANITFGHWTLFALTLTTGLGALILGGNAKDQQVHSTAAQVQVATIDAGPQPDPATVAAAQAALDAAKKGL
jgi:hypothetical protein